PEELAQILGATDETLETVRGDAGARLSPLLGTADYLARTTAMPVIQPVDAPRDSPIVNARLAVDPLLDERLRIVDGRRPGALEFLSPGPLEVLVSVATAEAMRWEIGDVRRIPTVNWPLELVGIFEAADPGDR